ncbi:MAG: stage II sporulation protein R [Clostridia bacterium]|nr:stage II sporulation protein R [Clostridia bacterium]
MKKFGTLLLTFCILFLILGILPIHGESAVYDQVLRLHVLADSDSDTDQKVKLQVRDAILEETKPLLSHCASRDEAEQILKENLDTLTAAAQNALREAGSSHTVTLELGEEEYPTRTYEHCAFPSGKYLSLRVRIGSGEGKNWWCVLFPPMCLSAASAQSSEDAFISVGFTDEQYRVITETQDPTYTVRFKLLEVFEKHLGQDSSEISN